MSTEIELKLLLDAGGLAALKRNPALAAMAAAPAKRQTLHARYYDTADGALGANGIALRVRREGRVWIQTVKTGRAASAGFMTVAEHASPVPGGRLDLSVIADAALRATIEAAAAEAPLTPQFETHIRREAYNLASPLGGTVELALDRGEIVAGAASAPLIEAELELKQGDPRDLYAVAEALFPAGPLRFSRRSKAARGAALARGEAAVHLLPPIVHSAAVKLDPSQTTESALRDVLRSALDQVAANIPATLASDAPEGPHQLRVGLRRLRTAFLLFRPLIDGSAGRVLDAEARDLAACVGALRDLDVLDSEIVAPLAGRDTGFAALREVLALRRTAARAAVCKRLAEGRTIRLVLQLGAFVEARGWLRPADFAQSADLAMPVSHFATEAVARRWRKARALARNLAELQGEERHALRRSLKKLRYTIEFTSSLWPERKVEPFLRALKGLQEDFGALQDAAMARAVLLAPGAPGADDPAVQRAAGYTLGVREAEAERVWHSAQADWRSLTKAPRFWRQGPSS